MPTRSTRIQIDDQSKDHIDPKGPKKRTAPNNFMPMTCLPIMWKILTVQIREEIYYALTSRRLFPEEQKGYCNGSRGTAEILYIDHHILKRRKTWRKNLAMAWIEYKGIWYGSAKWNNKLPQNVQNIKFSHKSYRKNLENLESGIDSRRKKLSWSKEPKEIHYHHYYS